MVNTHARTAVFAFLAFSSERPKTIWKRYVWTRIFFLKKRKNLRSQTKTDTCGQTWKVETNNAFRSKLFTNTWRHALTILTVKEIVFNDAYRPLEKKNSAFLTFFDGFNFLLLPLCVPGSPRMKTEKIPNVADISCFALKIQWISFSKDR